VGEGESWEPGESWLRKKKKKKKKKKAGRSGADGLLDEIFFIIVLYNHPLVILGFLSLFLEVSLGKNVVSLPPCFGGGGILDVGPASGQ
jgi:hypothetical protein